MNSACISKIETEVCVKDDQLSILFDTPKRNYCERGNDLQPREDKNYFLCIELGEEWL